MYCTCIVFLFVLDEVLQEMPDEDIPPSLVWRINEEKLVHSFYLIKLSIPFFVHFACCTYPHSSVK